MASLSATCLIASFFLLVLIQTSVDAELSCYTCGKLDKGCNDPVERKQLLDYITDCKKDENVCVKIRNPEEDDVASRRCGKQDDCKKYKSCYECPDHLCNSSPNLMPSFIVVGIASIALRRYL